MVQWLRIHLPMQGDTCLRGFPGGSDGEESVYNAGTWVRSLDQEDSLEKGMATHSSQYS